MTWKNELKKDDAADFKEVSRILEELEDYMAQIDGSPATQKAYDNLRLQLLSDIGYENDDSGLALTKQMQLTAQPDGKWKLKTFTMGAANKTETYPKAMIVEALRNLGLTWQQADENSQSGEALEVFMNKNNPDYYYSRQIDGVLRDLVPNAPYLQGK